MVSVFHHMTRKIVNLEGSNMAGSTKQLRESSAISEIGLMTRLAEHEMALLRSQSGPYASFLTRIAPVLFRVLLLRRVRLPLPLSFRLRRCGRPLDSFGHHRAACSRAGVSQEGANLPRTHWTTRSGSIGGSGWRGGRPLDETRSFLCQLARAKARSEPSILRGRAEQAWRLRWASTLACSAARAFAASLLNLRVGGGVDGDVPRTHEVVNEFRHAGLE